MSLIPEQVGRTILINKGTYSSSITYSKLDIVTYNDLSYVAKQSTIGHAPTSSSSDEYWMLLGKNRTYTPSLVNNILRFT